MGTLEGDDKVTGASPAPLSAGTSVLLPGRGAGLPPPPASPPQWPEPQLPRSSANPLDFSDSNPSSRVPSPGVGGGGLPPVTNTSRLPVCPLSSSETHSLRTLPVAVARICCFLCWILTDTPSSQREKTHTLISELQEPRGVPKSVLSPGSKTRTGGRPFPQITPPLGRQAWVQETLCKLLHVSHPRLPVL